MARVRASVPATANGPATSVTRYRPGDENLFPEDVYRSLHQARTIGGALTVEHELGWRTPVIGPLWRLVRRRIHQEIRIYIDALSNQQSNLNVHLIRALNAIVETLDRVGLPSLARRLEQQEETISQLSAEVRRLRAQVDKLHARLELLDAPPVAPADQTRG